MPELLRRHWALWLALFSLVTTVISAAAVLMDWSRRAGQDLGWGRALVWQSLVYATWAPFAWAALWMVRTLGLNARLGVRLYVATLLAAGLHALLTIWLDSAFRSHGIDFRALQTRLPIDLLIATAIAAAVVALEAQSQSRAQALRAAELEAALNQARRSAAPAAPKEERILVAAGRRRAAVALADVEWFGAAGNYVVVNWDGGEGLVRETLQGLADRLDPVVFARSHRSAVVNLAKVRQATSLTDGSWRLTLESGAEIVVSRTYRDEILRRLGR